jgi:hypothetical protein
VSADSHEVRQTSSQRRSFRRRLDELRAARDALVAEAEALEAEDTYVVLAASNWLTGVTAERVRLALARVAEVRQGLGLLDDLIARAEEALGEPHVDKRQTAQLLALVCGPSIVMAPAFSLADNAAPPGGSDAPSLRRFIPGELLRSLANVLTPARDVVAQVDAAWRALVPRLDRVKVEAERLAGELPRLQALAAARALLKALPDRIVEDPLGADDELTKIEWTVACAARARVELARLREAVAGAARTLADLERLVAEGRDAFDRSRTEIVSPEGLLEPVDPDVMSREPGLRPWLARLEQLVLEGDVSRVGAGLDRWRALADETMVVARQVAEVNARPWRRHRELLGLLRAARVKAGAVGRAEDPRVTELAARAMRSLAVPCDLPAAESAVEAFLEELRNPAPSSAGAGGVTASGSDATGTTGGAARAPGGVTGTGTTGDEGPAEAGGGPPRAVPGAADTSVWAQADPAHERRPQSLDALEADRGVGVAT